MADIKKTVAKKSAVKSQTKSQAKSEFVKMVCGEITANVNIKEVENYKAGGYVLVGSDD